MTMSISILGLFLSKSLTKASSGSSFGSTPNSKPAPVIGAPAPSSPTMTGELRSASDNIGPGGTVTRCELSGPKLIQNVIIENLNGIDFEKNLEFPEDLIRTERC